MTAPTGTSLARHSDEDAARAWFEGGVEFLGVDASPISLIVPERSK